MAKPVTRHCVGASRSLLADTACARSRSAAMAWPGGVRGYAWLEVRIRIAGEQGGGATTARTYPSDEVMDLVSGIGKLLVRLRYLPAQSLPALSLSGV